MTVKVSVMSRYCIVQLLMLAVVRGERHVVDWSIAGVRNYTGWVACLQSATHCYWTTLCVAWMHRQIQPALSGI